MATIKHTITQHNDDDDGGGGGDDDDDNDKIIIIIIIIIIKEKKEAEKILKHKDLTTEIQRVWNVKNKGDTSNNWSDWNHFQIIQKIRERHTRKP